MLPGISVIPGFEIITFVVNSVIEPISKVLGTIFHPHPDFGVMRYFGVGRRHFP